MASDHDAIYLWGLKLKNVIDEVNCKLVWPGVCERKGGCGERTPAVDKRLA